MAEEDVSSEEKSEEPSQRKIQKAHEKGDFVFSKEVPNVMIFLLLVGLFFFFELYYINKLEFICKKYLNFTPWLDLTPQTFTKLLIEATMDMVPLVMPVFGGVMAAALLGSVSQVGFNINSEALAFKLNKLDPIKGFKKIFSLNSLFEGMKSTAKVALVIIIAYITFRIELDHMPVLMTLSVREMLGYMTSVTLRISFHVAIFMIILAIVDYSYQRWSWMKKQRMTMKEVKDERKETDGNPQIKSRQRQIQMQAAMNRMMQDVPKADVIITNPTHFAIAIEYDRHKHRAPIVIAKGQEIIAKRIREIAKENDIPIVENKPLARGLYKHAELGKEIPLEFFKAVAETLAYVYRLKNKVHEWVKA